MISVIMLTYNRLAMLERAVDSFLRQDFNDKELVIIDNGSTDGTEKYLEDLKEFKASICTYRLDKNNIYTAYSLAHDFAQGEIVVMLADDDEFAFDGALTRYARFFDDNSEVEACYCNVVAKKDGLFYRAITPGIVDVERMKKSDAICFGGMAWRHSVVQEIGFIQDYVRYQADFDFKLRLLIRGGLKWLNECLYIINMHDGQDTNRMTEETRKLETEIIYKRLGI